MITRLMLSLKKVGSAQNGWSFLEMTTAHRADEMGSRLRYVDRPRHSLDEDRLRRFRTQRMDDLEGISVDVPEGIEMDDTKNSEEAI